MKLHELDISLTYLRSIVSKDGGADEDIKSRINKAWHAFNSLRPRLELFSALQTHHIQHQREGSCFRLTPLSVTIRTVLIFSVLWCL